jgi:hypothetical protein
LFRELYLAIEFRGRLEPLLENIQTRGRARAAHDQDQK